MASSLQPITENSDISIGTVLLIIVIMIVAIAAVNWPQIPQWLSQLTHSSEVIKYPDQISVVETTVGRPIATPMWKEPPAEVDSIYLPPSLSAKNFRPITEVQAKSFNPITQLPILPAGTKNFIPLASISATRGQVDYSNYATLYHPQNTQDADWVTNWRTVTDADEDFAYIEYQFAHPIQLQQLRFKADWDSKAGFDEQITLSFWIINETSSEWQLVATKSLTKQTMQLGHSLTFTALAATHLRVQYDDADDAWGGWGNIYEVQAIGK